VILTRAKQVCLIAAALWCGAPASLAAEIDKIHGSTDGLMSDRPEWSAGVQIGNYGATGVNIQYLGILGGTLNQNIGIAYGGVLIGHDLLWNFDQEFNRYVMTSETNYNDIRGRVMPFLGVGLQFGNGIGLRVPAGMQYTMTRDPFSFHGGATLIIGRSVHDDDVGVGVWFHLGVGVLL
jgi:hypothetical protein